MTDLDPYMLTLSKLVPENFRSNLPRVLRSDHSTMVAAQT